MEVTLFVVPCSLGQCDITSPQADCMTNEIAIAPSPEFRPAALFTPTPKAARRVLEFFTAQINNDHTRRAYMNATRRFADWCARQNIDALERVEPFHVAAFIKDLQDELSPPSVGDRVNSRDQRA